MPVTMPNRTRVALLVRPAEGGIRNHVATLLSCLDLSHFDVDLFAPPDFSLPPFAPEVTSIPLPIASRTNLRADVRTIRRCIQLLRQKPYHLIHAHGLRAAWIGALASRQVGIPLLFTAHNLLVSPSSLERLAVRYIAARARLVLAVSSAVRASLQAAGVNGTKVAVVPNGISLAPFDYYQIHRPNRVPFGVPEDAPLVAGVGRLSPEKGFDTLLDAMMLVREKMPTVHLLLAGAGTEEKGLRLHRFIRSGQGVMPGFVEDTASVLAAADVVAIPSRQEGQGIVALEAMAARKPVVATRVGGLPETVVEGETGLLVPPNEAPALADALAELLADSERRTAMGEAGRRRVEAEYTAERMTQQIARFYIEIQKRVKR
jgi:glycosyltransferase involved in cell wall biosynthesis